MRSVIATLGAQVDFTLLVKFLESDEVEAQGHFGIHSFSFACVIPLQRYCVNEI